MVDGHETHLGTPKARTRESADVRWARAGFELRCDPLRRAQNAPLIRSEWVGLAGGVNRRVRRHRGAQALGVRCED